MTSPVSSCSSDCDASEIFAASLMSQIDRNDVRNMVSTQRDMLSRFEKTNEMLINFNILSANRFAVTSQDFKKHTQLMYDMKKDLDSIFKRIRIIKERLSKSYPNAFKACESNSPLLEDEEDEFQSRSTDSQSTLDGNQSSSNGNQSTTSTSSGKQSSKSGRTSSTSSQSEGSKSSDKSTSSKVRLSGSRQNSDSSDSQGQIRHGLQRTSVKRSSSKKTKSKVDRNDSFNAREGKSHTFTQGATGSGAVRSHSHSDIHRKSAESKSRKN